MHLVSSYIVQPWEKSFLGMSQFDGFFSTFFVFMHDRNSPSFIYSWFVKHNTWAQLHNSLKNWILSIEEIKYSKNWSSKKYSDHFGPPVYKTGGKA